MDTPLQKLAVQVRGTEDEAHVLPPKVRQARVVEEVLLDFHDPLVRALEAIDDILDMIGGEVFAAFHFRDIGRLGVWYRQVVHTHVVGVRIPPERDLAGRPVELGSSQSADVHHSPLGQPPRQRQKSRHGHRPLEPYPCRALTLITHVHRRPGVQPVRHQRLQVDQQRVRSCDNQVLHVEVVPVQDVYEGQDHPHPTEEQTSLFIGGTRPAFHEFDPTVVLSGQIEGHPEVGQSVFFRIQVIDQFAEEQLQANGARFMDELPTRLEAQEDHRSPAIVRVARADYKILHVPEGLFPAEDFVQSVPVFLESVQQLDGGFDPKLDHCAAQARQHAVLVQKSREAARQHLSDVRPVDQVGADRWACK